MHLVSRYTSSALVLIAVAATSAVFLIDQDLYHALLFRWGGYPSGIPFIDLNSTLRQIECYRLGIDLFANGDADPRCGTFNYSPLLLRLAIFNIDPSASYIAGLLASIIFALCMATLPAPQNLRDTFCMAAAVLSGMTVWALASCNIDLLLFETVFLIAAVLRLDGYRRVLAYVLILTIGLMKYYPVVLLVHIVRERLKLVIIMSGIAFVTLVIFLSVFLNDFFTSIQSLPRGPYFRDWWGAMIFPYGVYNLLTGIDPQDHVPGSSGSYIPQAVLGCLLLLALIRAVLHSRKPALATAFAGLAEWDKMLLVSGALVIVGCFAAWQNQSYRGIFFLLVIPGLLSMRRSARLTTHPEIARLPLWILLLMWGEPIWLAFAQAAEWTGIPPMHLVYEQILFWAVRQVIWWHVVSVLAGLLIIFLRQSPAWNELVRGLRIRNGREPTLT